MEQLRLFDDSVGRGRAWVPLTPARILLAILSALVAAFGLTISGVHWGAIDPGLSFGPKEIALLTVAVVSVLSGSLAKSKVLRIVTFSVVLIIASWFGASTWLQKVLVGAATVAGSVALSWLFSRVVGFVRRRRRLRFRGNDAVASGALACVWLLPALAAVAITLVAAVPDAQAAVATCDQGVAQLTAAQLTQDGDQTEFALGDEVIVELPTDSTVYTFEAAADRPGHVRIEFDAFEPFDFTGDTLLWAEEFTSNEPALYEVVIERTGFLKAYEIHFDDRPGRPSRAPVAVVPGRTRLRATFVFDQSTDNADALEPCELLITVHLLTEPFRTLPGLLALTAPALGLAAIGAHRPEIERPSPTPRPPSKRTLKETPKTRNITTAANSTEEFAVKIKLSGKIDHDEEKLREWENAQVRAVGFSEFVRLLEMKPTLGIEYGALAATVAGKLETSDKEGTWLVGFTLDYASESSTTAFEVTVGGDEIIDVRRVTTTSADAPSTTQSKGALK